MTRARLGLVVVLAACDTPELAGRVTRVDHGFDPDAMAVADLDRDGVEDVVAVSGGLRTVGVAWGGAGQVIWSLAEEAAGVAVGDFDGDGRLDVATALPAVDEVAVLRGRDGRALAEARRISVGAGPRAVLAVQLDDDAAHELVVANTVDGTVSVVDGLAADSVEVVGPGPRGLAAGDVDGDGDQDVAVALADVDRVQLLLGTGDGRLTPGPAYAVGSAPRAVVVAELDGEAGLDMATLDALDATVSVLRGDGAGGLRGRDTFATPPHPVALAAVPRDAQRSRLAVLSREAETVIEIDAVSGPVLCGRADDAGALASMGGEPYVGGAGRVAPLATAPGLQFAEAWTGPVASAIQPVDLNGDGVDEVVVALGLAGVLEWWREGVKIGGVDPGLGAAFVGVDAADMNGDGRRDILVWSGNSVAVALAAADGTYTPGAPLRFDSQFSQVLIGDADGDGDSDLLIFWSSGGYSRIDTYAVDAGGALVRSDSLELMQYLANLQLIDFGGGDAVDLMWNANGLMAIAEDAGRGPWTFLPPVDVLADLDGDGTLDGVLCEWTTLQIRRDYLRHSGDEPEILGQTLCAGLEVRDLDGDGRADILVEHHEFSAYQQRYVLEPWLNEGDGFVMVSADTVLRSGWSERRGYFLANLDGHEAIDLIRRDEEGRVVAERGALKDMLAEGGPRRFGGGGGDVLADIDGDGAADLVAAGTDVLVARGDGRGGFGPAVTIDVGAMHAVVRGNLDADGREDVIMHASTSGKLVRLTAGEDGVTREVVGELAVFDEKLHIADVDGDRVMDIVTSAFGRSWIVSRGRGDGSFEPSVVGDVAVTNFPSVLTVADTDGDGRAELIGGIHGYTDASPAAAPLGLWRGRWTAESGFTIEDWLPTVNPTQVVIGDVDGDLAPDVVAVLGSSLVLVSGRGAVGPPWKALLDDVTRVAIGDVDADGAQELIALGGGALYLGRRAGEGWVFTSQEVPVRGAVDSLEVRDLDGDGAREVVITDAYGATIVRLR